LNEKPQTEGTLMHIIALVSCNLEDACIFVVNSPNALSQEVLLFWWWMVVVKSSTAFYNPAL
jgi:hypothetical protein